MPSNEHDSDCEVTGVSATATPSREQRRDSITNISPSLGSPISPPPFRQSEKHSDNDKENPTMRAATYSDSQTPSPGRIPSPIHLSTVNGLADSTNVDTVSLRDILGDPLIKECWLFNYLIDVHFIMSQLDEDTKDLVQVKIVHGSWKEEDANRINIEVWKPKKCVQSRNTDHPGAQDAAKNYKNVQVITAYMAEMYGKQAFLSTTGRAFYTDIHDPFPMGSGLRFKRDILSYLNSYGQRRTGTLTAELRRYDLSSIRAALVASVPGKQNLRDTDPDQETLWGWPGLRHVLRSVGPKSLKSKPHIVMQCSSVASISKKWMDSFQNTLRIYKSMALSPSPRPVFSLVFPTADEIRRSVDGYACGGSIHMKTQTPAQRKQLEVLRPILCHWAGDEKSNTASGKISQKPIIRQAQRRRAAPHIKTYIRFSDASMKTIDWAMMTSANLSKQAWGEEVNEKGEVRICSYEIGIVVWPALWDDRGETEIVPVFGKDIPDEDNVKVEDPEEKKQNADDEETTDEEGGKGTFDWRQGKEEQAKTRVGLRMPYDLPLVPYSEGEMPWCASTPCAEPDWTGRTWPGFGTS
ncbi:MAG: hypothetical protein Q9171_006222 [Xanthocarpia ochracea]